MKILQTVVGNPGSPIPGQSIYDNEVFRNATIEFLIVNNVPENGLQPDPDFTGYPLEARLQRRNQWVLGDKVIIIYSKCNC